jgi:hypothetical protein
MWEAYNVSVKPIIPTKISYYTGEDLIRGWTIYNGSTEILKNFSVLCIQGDICCMVYIAKFNFYDFSHIIIEPKTSGDIYIREIITENRPGYYKSEWRLVSNDRMSSFGPKLYYEVQLINK